MKKPIVTLIIFLTLSLLSGCVQHRPILPEEESMITQKLKEPKQCLALSGGGLRAASTSLGVLRALHHNDLYNDIDIISAASGGGWPVLWVHEHISAGYTLDDIFGAKSSKTTDFLKEIESTPFLPPITIIPLATLLPLDAINRLLFGNSNASLKVAITGP